MARKLTQPSQWWDILQAAIVFMMRFGHEEHPPDPKWGKRHAYEWWGYRADLRHAGLLEACRTGRLAPEQQWEVAEQVTRNGAAYPSGSQAWGPYHAIYKAEVEREEEQQLAN